MPTSAPHSAALYDDLYEYARRFPDSDASWYILHIHIHIQYNLDSHRFFLSTLFFFYALGVVFGPGLSLIYLFYLLYLASKRHPPSSSPSPPLFVGFCSRYLLATLIDTYTY